MPVSERDMMGGLAKGLAVIESFSPDSPRQSISEVSAATGLDRATARRCLLTLAHLGYADHDGKYFALAPRVLRLGTACLATMKLPQLVQPMLDEISDELGESASVSILDGSEIVYVARAAQRKVMSIALMPGSRLPAYCTSMGRVMLAALPEAEARQRIGSDPLPRRTPHTLTEPEAILSELSRVRSQGYAVIDQEVEIGLRSVAVPLMSARRVTVAAVNFGLPARGEPIEPLIERYLPALRSVSARLRDILR